jgi:4-diphosphocytidyl-2-C-methyl-D-erythritol kinase
VRKHNPEVNEAYLWLKNHGDAKLTGTGACLFLALDDHETAERLKNTVPEKWQSWVCHGSNVSSTHSELDQWIEQHRH